MTIRTEGLSLSPYEIRGTRCSFPSPRRNWMMYRMVSEGSPMESKSSIFLPNTKKMWKERIIFVHMKIEEDYSIKKHTTFGIDADVSYYVEYDSEEELKELIESGFLLDREVLALGGGSNILFCDDFDGVVLHSEIKGMEIVERKEDSVLVKVGAGEVWDDFVAWTITQGFYGAENLSDIPGSVGATPVQNIGAYGVEAKDLIERVECVDTKSAYTVTFENQELFRLP